MSNHPNDPKKIAIISFSGIDKDARVLRQVERLAEYFVVEVIGYGRLPSSLQEKARMFSIDTSSTFVRKSRKGLFLPLGKVAPKFAYESWYWSESAHTEALKWLEKSNAEVIHANDWTSLPVAVRAAQKLGAQVVLDLHEYAPLMREDSRYWKFLYKPKIEYFLKKYLHYISASITVNSTIANRYEKEFGIRPLVVMNVPKCSEMSDFRSTDPEHIRLIHHGRATRVRQLELMIHSLALLHHRYTLHFMLVDSDGRYVAELKALAQRLAPGRIFFHQPVPPAEIVRKITEFDIGFHLLPPTSFNHLAASPNKFFDFVMAGLAVCIGPSLEMARLTQKFGFGLVAPSFEPEQVANVLNSLDPKEIDRMKRKAMLAQDSLNADVELEKLTNLYFDIFSEL